MDNITIMEIETIIHESIKENINIKKIIKKNISKKYGKNRHENIERWIYVNISAKKKKESIIANSEKMENLSSSEIKSFNPNKNLYMTYKIAIKFYIKV